MTDHSPDDPQQPEGDPSGQFSQRIRHEQVSARVPEDISPGVFATGALVLNGPHEFIIDFLQSVSRPHQVVARIVLPTTIMPSMLRAMQQNLDNYENRFGPLPELPKPGPGGRAAASAPAAEKPEADNASAAQQADAPDTSPAAPTPGEASGGGQVVGPQPGSVSEGPSDTADDAGHPPPAAAQPTGEETPQPAPPSVEEIYGQLKLPEPIAVGTYANTVMITHSPAEFCFDFITSFYPRSTVTARIFMAAAQVPRVHTTLQRAFDQYKTKLAARRQRKRPPTDPPVPPESGSDEPGDER